MTILVTGGAGYIGSHFILSLLADESVKIVVVDNYSQGKSNIIVNDKVVYHELDILDLESLKNIFGKYKFDIVAHFAALASVPDSIRVPEDYYINNLTGTLNVLKCMRESDVDKIIFSSSASVYGEPTTETIAEDHPKQPTNPYGYTKLVIENILHDYNKAYGLNSISFRYLCASGCDESLKVGEFHKPETHVIPCILETILGKRKEFFVYGNDFPTPDGSGVRDYVHVNDIASAHKCAIEKLFSEKNVCSVYNLGINKGFSVLELIKAAEKVTGLKLSYKVAARRPGDPSRLVADATKAKSELGWKPKYLEVEDIIRSAYNFKRKI